MIEVTQLNKQVATVHGELHILCNIEFSIERGASLAITGASGSGKSTLLSLLAGLDTASSGRILIDAVDITGLDEDQRAEFRSQNVGFVFQSFHLLPTLTALENIALPLELNGQHNAQDRAKTLLAQVGLTERADHYPKQLSGGEQQRVAIARGFASEPKLLFADEPTGNLDSGTGQHIIELLFALNQQRGTTLILVTHDQQLAQKCEQIITLDSGHIVGNTNIN